MLDLKILGVDCISIMVRRNTGSRGIFGSVNININGEKVGKIKEGERMVVDLPEDNSHLKVTQSGIKSKEVEVSSGDIVEITTTSINRISWVLFLLVLAILGMILQNRTYFIGVIIAISVYIISIFFMEGFHLKVTDGDEEKIKNPAS